ncbi:MAG: hypothetical protein QOJ07_2213, partial [Thermoleophilaceae bacterium]|nr:hypothetical protein [Thermoleophilaceae bacterium]
MRSHRVVLLALALLEVAVPAAAQASAPVTISEFRTRGPSAQAGSDEFVELYNATSSPISVGGYKLRGSNNAGSIADRATIPGPTTISAGCHYLFTNSVGYSGGVVGDQTYSTGIADDGGVALTLADNTVVDQVGMSGGSAFKEGTPLTPLSTATDQSYERGPGGPSGNGTDTDDNAADFQVLAPSAPQDSASACIPTAAADDSATVAEDSAAAAIDVRANDSGAATIASVAQPSHGTVVITGSGTGLTYQPAADYCGADSFTYTLNGGSSATVSVTVSCVDDPPHAAPDSATVAQDSGATVVDVLANDTDADGGPKSVASVTQPGHGTAAVSGSGVSYQPVAGYCGPDSFAYTLNGGSSATVSLTVTCATVTPPG